MNELENREIRVESVFEESVCATCGRFGVDKYSRIDDSFIKYKNQLISFISIIQKTLEWTPLVENCSMQICEHCKVKLQDFYNFKLRSEQVREIQHESAKLLELDKELQDPVVFSTLQIVHDYVNKYSVSSIDVDESTKRLIITSAMPEEDLEGFIEVTAEPPESFVEEDLSEINPIEEECSLDEVTEYVEEDYIEEISEDDEVTQDSEMMSYDEEIISEETKEELNQSTSKRPRNPEQWACNQRKKLRNSGKSYINSKGKRVGPRQMKPPCGASCRMRCYNLISEADRQMNFHHFWNLGDVVEQRKFLNDHLTAKEPTTRRVQNSNRTMTLEFYLDASNGEKIRVCKKMFKNTLAVSNQVIQGVVRKYAKTNFADLRGRHERKLTEAQEIARQHVQKFPYFYIDQNMTKIQLYNMYCEECRNQGIEPIKESNYRDIFARFNSNSFLKSEKILCEKCHKYYKSPEDQRVLLQKDHDEHLATDRRCRDRALARIRSRKSLERKRAEKLANQSI